MLIRMRLSLPDRPGSLARVTNVLSALGADVRQVTVFARESGRAWDDFVLRWQDRQPISALCAALESGSGVVVEGAWPTIEVPGYHPAIDLLHQIVKQPSRRVETLVDALPGVISARWAAAVRSDADGGTVRSVDAPSPEEFADVSPVRASTFTRDGIHFAAVPAPAMLSTIVVGRVHGAPFHAYELDLISRLVELVDALPPSVQRATVAAHAPGGDEQL